MVPSGPSTSSEPIIFVDQPRPLEFDNKGDLF